MTTLENLKINLSGNESDYILNYIVMDIGV